MFSQTIYYSHADHLGSIISITDANGTPAFKASYDAWGKQTVTLNTIGFHRGYTGHEHLPEFGLINMNGRMYDPAVGRFLSPDPYVADDMYSQDFNRYTYARNNPLIYTDPTGEWSWLTAGVGLLYGYLSHGLMHGNWGWNALGQGVLTGLSWGLGYTAKIEAAGVTPLAYAGQSAISSTINHVMPSVAIPINNNFAISASPGFGVGTNGLTAGLSQRITYVNGKHAVSLGFSAGTGGTTTSASYGYDGFSYGMNYYGQDANGHNQMTGFVNVNKGDFHLHFENDFLAWNSQDRWRTQALEFGYKDVSIGSYVYTNDPKNEYGKDDFDINGLSLSGKPNKNGFGAWNLGEVLHAPLYIGVRSDNNTMRFGYSNRHVQDKTQNWVHREGFFYLPFGHQNYYNRYDQMYEGGYSYSGYRSPFSLFY